MVFNRFFFLVLIALCSSSVFAQILGDEYGRYILHTSPSSHQDKALTIRVPQRISNTNSFLQGERVTLSIAVDAYSIYNGPDTDAIIELELLENFYASSFNVLACGMDMTDMITSVHKTLNSITIRVPRAEFGIEFLLVLVPKSDIPTLLDVPISVQYTADPASLSHRTIQF